LELPRVLQQNTLKPQVHELVAWCAGTVIASKLLLNCILVALHISSVLLNWDIYSPRVW